MIRDALAGCRPKNDSPAAIRTALAAISRERDCADERRKAALDNRQAALRDVKATPKDIAAFELLAAEAAIEIERLDVLRSDLEARLPDAVRIEREASQNAAIARTQSDLADAVQRFQDAFPAYLDAAHSIVDFIELERRVAAARARFVSAVNAALPLRPAVPRMCTDMGVDIPVSDFANMVRLPGLPGDPSFIVGAPPQAPVAPHYYANEPRRWG